MKQEFANLGQELRQLWQSYSFPESRLDLYAADALHAQMLADLQQLTERLQPRQGELAGLLAHSEQYRGGADARLMLLEYADRLLNCLDYIQGATLSKPLNLAFFRFVQPFALALQREPWARFLYLNQDCYMQAEDESLRGDFYALVKQLFFAYARELEPKTAADLTLDDGMRALHMQDLGRVLHRYAEYDREQPGYNQQRMLLDYLDGRAHGRLVAEIMRQMMRSNGMIYQNDCAPPAEREALEQALQPVFEADARQEKQLDPRAYLTWGLEQGLPLYALAEVLRILRLPGEDALPYYQLLLEESLPFALRLYILRLLRNRFLLCSADQIYSNLLHEETIGNETMAGLALLSMGEIDFENYHNQINHKRAQLIRPRPLLAELDAARLSELAAAHLQQSQAVELAETDVRACEFAVITDIAAQAIVRAYAAEPPLDPVELIPEDRDFNLLIHGGAVLFVDYRQPLPLTSREAYRQGLENLIAKRSG